MIATQLISYPKCKLSLLYSGLSANNHSATMLEIFCRSSDSSCPFLMTCKKKIIQTTKEKLSHRDHLYGHFKFAAPYKLLSETPERSAEESSATANETSDRLVVAWNIGNVGIFDQTR